MSYTYLQEQGAESSAGCFADIPAYVLSRSKNTRGASCSNDSVTAACQDSLYGTTSKPSTERLGEDGSMSLPGASLAKTLQPAAAAKVSPAHGQDCGKKWRVSSTRYDHATSSWKIHPCLFNEVLPWSSVILPKWGMMLDGVLWEPIMSAHHSTAGDCGSSQKIHQGERQCEPMTDGTADDVGEMFSRAVNVIMGNGNAANVVSGLIHSTMKKATAANGVDRIMWPTPIHSEARQGYQDRSRSKKGGQKSLSTVVIDEMGGRKKVIGQLNPTWVEWLMGWPAEWTALKSLEMDKFRSWQHSHGLYL